MGPSGARVGVERNPERTGIVLAHPAVGILIVAHAAPAPMSDIPTWDAIVYTTHLRPCTTCGHPRGDHPEDGPCSTESCTCGRYGE